MSAEWNFVAAIHKLLKRTKLRMASPKTVLATGGRHGGARRSAPVLPPGSFEPAPRRRGLSGYTDTHLDEADLTTSIRRYLEAQEEAARRHCPLVVLLDNPPPPTSGHEQHTREPARLLADRTCCGYLAAAGGQRQSRAS